MGLGGQVHDRGRAVSQKNPLHLVRPPDIATLEAIPLVSVSLRYIGQIGGVGELIDIDDARIRGADQMTHNGRANEPGAVGNEDDIAAHASLGGRRAGRSVDGGDGVGVPSPHV